MTSNPCNWVPPISEGCLTRQTPITNDDAPKRRHNVQHGRYCTGEIFLNITTLILSFVYNSNIHTGGYFSSPYIITNCSYTRSILRQYFWTCLYFESCCKDVNKLALLFILWRLEPLSLLQ